MNCLIRYVFISALTLPTGAAVAQTCPTLTAAR